MCFSSLSLRFVYLNHKLCSKFLPERCSFHFFSLSFFVVAWDMMCWCIFCIHTHIHPSIVLRWIFKDVCTCTITVTMIMMMMMRIITQWTDEYIATDYDNDNSNYGLVVVRGHGSTYDRACKVLMNACMSSINWIITDNYIRLRYLVYPKGILTCHFLC